MIISAPVFIPISYRNNSSIVYDICLLPMKAVFITFTCVNVDYDIFFAWFFIPIKRECKFVTVLLARGFCYFSITDHFSYLKTKVVIMMSRVKENSKIAICSWSMRIRGQILDRQTVTLREKLE